MSYILRFDGASKCNPGEAGSGAVIFKDGKSIAQTYKYIGSYSTNNQAEYNGLIIGLELAISLKIDSLLIQGDSKLVIEQVSGNWKVKNPELQLLYEAVMRLIKEFDCLKIQYIPRKNNSIADFLANKAVRTKDRKVIFD